MSPAKILCLAFAAVLIATPVATASGQRLSPPADYHFVPTAGCDAPPKATQIYQSCADQMVLFMRALADATASNRRLIVVFGANWCPSCVGLKQVLPSVEVLGSPALSGRAHVIEIAVSTLAQGRVVPVPSGEAVLSTVLAGRDDVKLRSIPFFAMIDPKSGRTVVRNLGDLQSGGAWQHARLAEVVRQSDVEVLGGAKASGEPGWLRRKWIRIFGQ